MTNNKKFYAASTGGFYSQDIHGTAMPSDAQEVTEDNYQRLLELQAGGKEITPDNKGIPIARDPVVSKDSQLRSIRSTRNNLLTSSDWTMLADADLTDEEKLAWKAYRQALRDLPDTIDNPKTFAWPQSPAEASK